jgi:hypothetical protein
MRAAGNGDRHFEMNSHATRAKKRRFRFDHAKYAVVDGKSLLVGSENYSPTGNPEPNTKGNRGWEVFIHDQAITAEFEQIFHADSDMSHGDLIDVTQQDSPCANGPVDCSTGGNGGSGGGDPIDLWASPLLEMPVNPVFAPWAQPVSLEAAEVVRITSPDTSLQGLLDVINGAQTSLDIQQMTFDSKWGKLAPQSPLLDAVIAAARRGVRVRVLLNDERVFQHPGHPSKSKNQPTVDMLNQLGESEGLQVSAQIADIKRMGVTYIHNKGLLADGNKTLISSINWDSNAVINNREAAVLITSEAVNAHYAKLFDSDWKLSQRIPTSTNIQTSGVGLREIEVSEACPQRVRITVAIGELTPSDAEDRSFESLSDTRFESTFARVQGMHGCILMDTRATTRTGKSRFIQIRKKSDGNRSATIEGYTPNGKVYSIRTVLPGGPSIDGEYDASVYDGSGPQREKLGSAILDLTVLREASLIQ